MKTISIYDTTLRDGSQSEDISFTVEDKIRIAHKLDELGIKYIEGGQPPSIYFIHNSSSLWAIRILSSTVKEISSD